MPLVTVKAIGGKTVEQKRALVKDITEAVVKNFKSRQLFADSYFFWEGGQFQGGGAFRRTNLAVHHFILTLIKSCRAIIGPCRVSRL